MQAAANRPAGCCCSGAAPCAAAPAPRPAARPLASLAAPAALLAPPPPHLPTPRRPRPRHRPGRRQRRRRQALQPADAPDQAHVQPRAGGDQPRGAGLPAAAQPGAGGAGAACPVRPHPVRRALLRCASRRMAPRFSGWGRGWGGVGEEVAGWMCWLGSAAGHGSIARTCTLARPLMPQCTHSSSAAGSLPALRTAVPQSEATHPLTCTPARLPARTSAPPPQHPSACTSLASSASTWLLLLPPLLPPLLLLLLPLLSGRSRSAPLSAPHPHHAGSNPPPTPHHHAGDGTMRKAPDIWRRWGTNSGNNLHTTQLRITLRWGRGAGGGGRGAGAGAGAGGAAALWEAPQAAAAPQAQTMASSPPHTQCGPLPACHTTHHQALSAAPPPPPPTAAARTPCRPPCVVACVLHVCRACQLLRVGGRLVYSTCTFNPVEDEAVVAEVSGAAAFFRFCFYTIFFVNLDGGQTSMTASPGLGPQPWARAFGWMRTRGRRPRALRHPPPTLPTRPACLLPSARNPHPHPAAPPLCCRRCCGAPRERLSWWMGRTTCQGCAACLACSGGG